MANISIKSGLKVEDYNYKKISIVEFTGSLTEQNLYPIKEDLLKKFKTMNEYVAFDLAKVPFISMETLKELIDLNKFLMQHNKKVFLTKLQKQVNKFLSNSALANLFKIYENEEQVFQTYLSDKGLKEEDIEVFSSANKLNQWYNKIQSILSELKDKSSFKLNLIPETADAHLSVIIISRNKALGRGLNDAVREYKLTPHLISIEQIQEKIGIIDNLAGYIIDDFTEFDEIQKVITKVRNAESDFCKSMLPALICFKTKIFDMQKLVKISDMVYFIVDDSIDRESAIIKKIRNLYENIDKVIIYLTLNIRFELTTEICNFIFIDKISAEDAELFDAFVTDEFVQNLFQNMFTINFNYYDAKEADDLFFTTIHNLSEKFEQCVHFINKMDNNINRGIKNTTIPLNINVL